MSHLVSNFLRSSQDNISQIKKAARSRNASRNASCETTRNNSVSGLQTPSDSDSDDHVIRPHDLADAMKRHHKLSLPFGRSSTSSSRERSAAQIPGVASIDWNIESPPIVYHGTRDESTGALVSGQLFFHVKDEPVEVESFKGSLSIRTTHKRPYQSHCNECQSQVTEIQSWELLAHQTTLRQGRHSFPFSALLSGELPASLDTPVVSISYEFKAVAQLASSQATNGNGPNQIKFMRTLNVKRSVPDPIYPHHSVRVFPPTNIKATADFAAVIRPTGNNKLTLKLDGLMTHNEKFKTVDMWRLKKLTWKLEENIKTVAPACEKHAPTASTAEGDIKGLVRNEVRTIGEKSLHEGWKSDYTGYDGTVDMEFDFSVKQLKANSKDPKYACDIKTDNGTEVTHSLLLELIVSKDYAQEGKTHQPNATGTGRILRMHFAVTLSEYPGMGVSWDNEAPPIYGDVPPSPPAYPLDSPIDYEDLEPLYARRASVEPRASPPPSDRESDE